MGTMLEQKCCPNPDCGSSDAFTMYLDEDGKANAWCYSCRTYFDEKALDNISNEHEINTDSPAVRLNGQPKGQEVLQEAFKTNHYIPSIEEALLHPIREIKSRSISYQAAEKYGIRIGVDVRDGSSPVYSLIPMHKNGDLTGFFQKIPSPSGNTYRSIGDCKGCDLFGVQAIPQKGKKLFITEGWEDCLSLYQVLKENSSFNWEPSVIALQGAFKKKALLNSLELLDNYEEIILVLDNDHVGKEASLEIAKMFAGKSYIVSLPLKDPNEMLMAGRGDQLKWAALTGARKYQPDGILNAKDLWNRYEEAGDVVYYPFPDSMPILNHKMYGAKRGTVVTVAGGTSIGKTQFLRELIYHYLETTDLKIAGIELEADVAETLKSLVGLKLGKRITLPDVKVNKEEEKNAYEYLFGSGRYTVYDYFGGMDDDTLFSKLRYIANDGNDIIFLDNLSIIISEYASEGGERERIDTVMTKLAKLAKEKNICIVLAVHLKKVDGKSFEKGDIPSPDDMRGSASIKNYSWDVIFLSRNTQHSDPVCSRITEITSAKCRLTGRTGNAGYIKFDDATGRYSAVAPPPNYREKQAREN